MRHPEIVKVDIEAAASLSGEIRIADFRHFGIIIPDEWTAANLTIQIATRSTADGGVFKNLHDDAGNEVVITAAAGRAISIDAVFYKLAPWSYIRFRSGTNALPVAQAAKRSITLVMKG